MESDKISARRFLKSFRFIFALFLVLFLSMVGQLTAGVLVAPTSVILSDQKRTGRLTVQNPTDRPKQVQISFSFGVPVSDSAGNIKLEFQDSAVTDEHSALGWIKAFPKKMILEPNTSQVVRFLAKPPKDLPDGEYWARIMVRSQEGETSIPLPTDEDKITTKLNMIMQTAIVLKYRSGNLVSKLEVRNTDITPTDTAVYAYIDMVNRGNVSYVGILDCRLVDAKGKEISSNDIDLAVYRELMRKVRLPILPGDFARPYKVEVSISTEGRKDIAAEDLISGNKIEYSANVP
jgi:P pilus assembly chaperone PapD